MDITITVSQNVADRIAAALGVPVGEITAEITKMLKKRVRNYELQTFGNDAHEQADIDTMAEAQRLDGELGL